ncbi:MAG: sulfite exporter TauE/SafE family protein [Elusimicrobia bacterium]|nr:sulfite exporter TauE/SafE family protein [Elusimicrobiota bacterium]
MKALFAEGLALGLSTGLYCLGACAPFLVPYLLAEETGWRRDLTVLGKFLIGRLAAYMLFAVVVGYLGARAATPPPWLTGVAFLLCGLALIGYAVARNAPRPGACGRLAAPGMPLLMGFLAGINICPPFTAGLVRLLTLGSVGRCVVYFAAFYLGTTVYVAATLLLAPLKAVPRLRAAASIACGLSGLWFAAMGLAALR